MEIYLLFYPGILTRIWKMFKDNRCLGLAQEIFFFHGYFLKMRKVAVFVIFFHCLGQYDPYVKQISSLFTLQILDYFNKWLQVLASINGFIKN